MRVHCHLCGATLRNPHDVDRLQRADTGDEIVVCADVKRCDARIVFDPLAGAGSRTEEARTQSVAEVGRLRAQR
jgi:hypothetical protein